MLVDEVRETGTLTSFTVALDRNTGPVVEQPAMIDLRLEVAGGAVLAGIALSPDVVAANKQLFVDPDTGKPFRVLSDGTVQVLLTPKTGSARLSRGRWLFFRFDVPRPAAGTRVEPVVLRIIPRAETFAPVAADAVLAREPARGQLVLWPDRQGGG